MTFSGRGIGLARRMFLATGACGVMICGGAASPSCAAQESRAAERARETKPVQAGEVLVVVNEGLLNALLEAMVSLPSPPKFPLSRTTREAESGKAAACASEVTLVRESLGTRTAVRFADGRIDAPVAFRGSYDAALVGCLKFEGWAETSFELAFDPARQALTARLGVRDVHLKKVPSVLGGGLTQMVQEAIDRRVNPIEILRAEQLGVRLPVAAGSVLRLRAREVRHEIAQRELRLRIFYEIVRGE